MRNNSFVKLFFSSVGIAVSIINYYLLNKTTKFQEFSYHFGIIYLSVSVWFSFPDFMFNPHHENFFLNPTHLVLAIIVISSLLFAYKEVLIYSIFALINHNLFYLIAGVDFIIVMQKAIMVLIFLLIISFRSYFYYKKIANLKFRSIEVNKQKNNFLSNIELISNFLLSATSNLTSPINKFDQNLNDFKNSIDREVFNNNRENFDSITYNFNYIKSLLTTINEVKNFTKGDFDFDNAETNLKDIVSDFTHQFKNIQQDQRIFLIIQNDVKEKIYINKEVLLQILINLAKLKLNQCCENLNIQFRLINDNQKDILSITLSEIEEKPFDKNENILSNEMRYLESKSDIKDMKKKERVINSFEISLMILNLLISKVNGRFFTDSDNEFNIQIPIIVKV